MIVFFINIIALTFSLFVAGVLVGVVVSPPIRRAVKKILFKKRRRDLILAKVSTNPVLTPGGHPWNAEAVMNPAAFELNDRTYLLYRAIGSDGVSRLGYASSRNGIVFDERLPYPIYAAALKQEHYPGYRQYSPVLYPSGGSWGGCEDPRAVVVNAKVYVTFNLFDNWTLRVGYITLDKDDFLAHRFYKWDGPYILSHGSRDKNWVLFPEKIGGRFAVLHSIIGKSPDEVRVEYVDDLQNLRTQEFDSPDPQRAHDEHIAWHVHMRSAGPPPLKTDRGWLAFYHAHDAEDSAHYKLGAMLLDLADPTKVLYRSAEPVLVPDEDYENNGKPGIIYACGAVIRDGMLYLYYGGADKVVCVAFAPLEPFLKRLIEGEQPEFTVEPLETR